MRDSKILHFTLSFYILIFDFYTFMSIFNFLKRKNLEAPISTILPQEIYDSSALELKDIIAPSALRVTPKGINLRESSPKFFCHFLPEISGRKLVCSDNKSRQG